MGKRRVWPDGKTPYKFQKEGVKFILGRQRTLLADEMGLGKSIQAIIACNAWEPSSVVVVCPACVLINWVREWCAWTTLKQMPCCIWRGKKSAEDFKNAKVKLVSYASLHKAVKYVGDSVDVVIADEAHYLAKWTSQRTNVFINELLPKSRNAVLISGTPMKNGIPDLHPLASACGPSIFPPFKKFCETYSHPLHDGYKVVYRGTKNEEKLQSKLSKVMVRRFKKDVLPQLPDKVVKKHFVDIGQEAAKKSLQYVDYLQVLVDKGMKEVSDPSFAEVWRDLGEEKIAGVVDYINVSLRDGPIVVLGTTRALLEALKMHLKRAELGLLGLPVGPLLKRGKR